MTTLAFWIALVLGAADTACTESGGDIRDGAHVLEVVRVRAREHFGCDGTLWSALWARHQHAHGCRPPSGPVTWRHVELGVRFVLDQLPVESWARNALWYCGDADAPGTCRRRARPGHPVVQFGRVRHRYFGRARRLR